MTGGAPTTETEFRRGPASNRRKDNDGEREMRRPDPLAALPTLQHLRGFDRVSAEDDGGRDNMLGRIGL